MASARQAMTAAQDELDDAAEAHVTHRKACPQPGHCPACVSLAGAVVRLQHRAGLMRFGRASDEDLEVR